jgi:hypothetical protein
MGRTKVPFTEIVRPQAMYFGYLSLGKRTAQRVLAPHYIAFLGIEGEEAQGYQLVVPATEKTYLPLCQAGRQPPPSPLRRMAPSRQLQGVRDNATPARGASEDAC